MTTFAAKSDLMFEPDAVINLGTVANKYTTGQQWTVRLGGLAMINGVRGELKYKFKREGGTDQTYVKLTLRTAGGQIIQELNEINIPPNSHSNGYIEVDLGGISGGSPLVVDVETTTAEAGATALCTVVLTTETPVIVGGC